MQSPVSLDVIQIQNPCPADWDAMRGDDRVRFCGECKLHVYNLSAMSKTQAESLIASREGRLCVRYYQRADGTVITEDCSRIRRALRRTKLLLTGAGSALMMLMLAPFGFGNIKPNLPASPADQHVPAIQGDICGPAPVLMGKIAPPIPVMGEIGPVAPSTQPATQPTTAPTTQGS
jgi:hypothetical protein